MMVAWSNDRFLWTVTGRGTETWFTTNPVYVRYSGSIVGPGTKYITITGGFSGTATFSYSLSVIADPFVPEFAFIDITDLTSGETLFSRSVSSFDSQTSLFGTGSFSVNPTHHYQFGLSDLDGQFVGSSSASFSVSWPDHFADITHTAVRTASCSGYGLVNAGQGEINIGGFYAPPRPQQGGTISGVSYSLTWNDARVVLFFSDTRTTTTANPNADIFASTVAPVVITGPQSVLAASGQSVSFSVDASGASPLSYAWLFTSPSFPEAVTVTLYGITTVAGNGVSGYAGNGGPAVDADLFCTSGPALDRLRNLLFADPLAHLVRKVDTDGVITIIAGDGTAGYSGDGGPATNAQLNYPYAVAADTVGNLFIADQLNNRVRKVDTNGIITTVAGDGASGFGGDGGSATRAQLNVPWGVAVDGGGNLFIADYSNQRIRKVGPQGVISTVAGNGFSHALYGPGGGGGGRAGGYSGDGGPASAAELNCPSGVALDGLGNLFIADECNNRVRKVDADGLITTVAGIGTSGFGGDGGPAIDAELFYPCALAVDSDGDLFIADSQNSRVRWATQALGATLALSNVTTNNVGQYRVIVSNAYGSVTSGVAQLTVASP